MSYSQGREREPLAIRVLTLESQLHASELACSKAKAKADSRKVQLEELQKQYEKSQAEVWLAMLEAEGNAEKLTQREVELGSLTSQLASMRGLSEGIGEPDQLADENGTLEGEVQAEAHSFSADTELQTAYAAEVTSLKQNPRPADMDEAADTVLPKQKKAPASPSSREEGEAVRAPKPDSLDMPASVKEQSLIGVPIRPMQPPLEASSPEQGNKIHSKRKPPPAEARAAASLTMREKEWSMPVKDAAANNTGSQEISRLDKIPAHWVPRIAEVTAAADEEALLTQLRNHNMHLESSLKVANAQLSVGRLDLQSVQRAYEEAVRQLTSHETDVFVLAAQLASQELDLQKSNVWSKHSDEATIGRLTENGWRKMKELQEAVESLEAETQRWRTVTQASNAETAELLQSIQRKAQQLNRLANQGPSQEEMEVGRETIGGSPPRTSRLGTLRNKYNTRDTMQFVQKLKLDLQEAQLMLEDAVQDSDSTRQNASSRIGSPRWLARQAQPTRVAQMKNRFNDGYLSEGFFTPLKTGVRKGSTWRE